MHSAEVNFRALVSAAQLKRRIHRARPGTAVYFRALVSAAQLKTGSSAAARNGRFDISALW